ncbi:MAG TPA: aminotransferase class I/II-fold pyridoxal phosphate-dependent enzyme, partial [Bacillota bacterium]|nr:aminotransferase class I/II-fold pyridoxal phosphate-dependent enzyme [Bacillota bacterium]
TDMLAKETGIIALITDEDAGRAATYPVILADSLVPDWRDPQILAQFSRKSGDMISLKAEDRPDWSGHITLCTSGTTGMSRCFVHDNFGIAEQFKSLFRLTEDSDRWIRDDVREKVLAFIPWHHIFGFFVCFILPQVLGSTMVIPMKPSPEAILQACQGSGVTQLVAIPAVWNGIARAVKKRFTEATGQTEVEFDELIELSLSYQKAGVDLPPPIAGVLGMIRSQLFGETLHLGVSGGGPVLPEALRTINGLGYHLVNGYGMTEIGIFSVVISEDVDDRLDGSVGYPLYEHSLVVDPIGEVPAHDDECEQGELLVRTGAVYAGMLKDGRFTARDRGEWFRTGDIGRRCGGRVFLDGRVKDIILRADGENIYPDELETPYSVIPGVQRLVIFGLSDGYYDEVALLVEPVPGADPETLAEMVIDINAKVPMAHRVQRFFVSDIPLELSASAKVRRGPVSEAVTKGEWPLTEYSLSPRQAMPVEERPTEVDKQISAYFLPELAADPAFFEVRKSVQAMVSEVLSLPIERIKPSAWFAQDLGGDSLQSISLLTLAEEQYALTIDERLFNRDLTINDIAALVYRRIGGEFAEEPRAADHSSGKEKPVRRIKSFEETPEFEAFMARLELLAPAVEAFGNPYFVAQDSSLRDVSYIGDRKMINFASYNYVGMSGDPEVNEAAIAAIKQYGTSASGSRLLAGEKTVHQQLERALARWKGTEDAIALVGGHSTNVTFIGNFCSENDLILYDVLIHNSITEGIRMSLADARPFPHNDFKSLESILRNRRDRYEKVLIVIEGAYSMDGDVAPVPEFVRIKKAYDCFLMVDEAHSMLVLGETGHGVDEHFGIDPKDIDIHMGTLSKGFGTCGGYLAGSHHLIEYLRYNLPGFVFSVGISPPLAAAVIKAIEIMERDNSRVRRLRRNIAIFMREAERYGFDTCLAGETAVTPVMIGPDELAFTLSKQLEEDGIIVPPAVFPAVARGQARLRFCLTSEHTEEQIVYALERLHSRLMPYREQAGRQGENR